MLGPQESHVKLVHSFLKFVPYRNGLKKHPRRTPSFCVREQEEEETASEDDEPNTINNKTAQTNQTNAYRILLNYKYLSGG